MSQPARPTRQMANSLTAGIHPWELPAKMARDVSMHLASTVGEQSLEPVGDSMGTQWSRRDGRQKNLRRMRKRTRRRPPRHNQPLFVRPWQGPCLCARQYSTRMAPVNASACVAHTAGWRIKSLLNNKMRSNFGSQSPPLLFDHIGSWTPGGSANRQLTRPSGVAAILHITICIIVA